MTISKKQRRTSKRNQLLSLAAASLVAGATGCSSSSGERFASLNPFSSAPAGVSSGSETNWFSGPKNIGTSIADGAKSAATKSRDAVAGVFNRKTEFSRGAVEADPTDPTSLAHKAEVTPEVFVANGRLWESTGNFEKAMQSYGKALEKRPDDPEALANIARLHYRSENHQKAAEYFGKAIKVNPEDAGLYNDLGLTLNKMGNHNAASKTIARALELSPGSSRYANNLASVRFEGGDTAGALQTLVENNRPAVAHFNMAYLHYKHGQAAESSRHLGEALRYEPQAASDPATKRAIERSRQLLAQIGPVPGVTLPDAAIAANPAAPQSPTADASTAEGMATEGLAPGSQISGFSAAIQTVSNADSEPNVGKASYKTPTGQSATAPSATPAQSAPAQSAPAPSPQDSFALPPGFQLPN